MANPKLASFKWDKTALSKIQNGFTRGLVKMGFDVANKARHRAPYKTGALANSIRVTELQDEVMVVAGGNFAGKTIAYARIQELGGWAGRNHSAYIKPKHYLKNGFEDIVRGDIAKYFKGVA